MEPDLGITFACLDDRWTESTVSRRMYHQYSHSHVFSTGIETNRLHQDLQLRERRYLCDEITLRHYMPICNLSV